VQGADFGGEMSVAWYKSNTECICPFDHISFASDELSLHNPANDTSRSDIT